MKYKQAVLYFLKEYHNKNIQNSLILQQLEKIIKNKSLSDDQVYEFIYNKLSYICGKDVNLIISWLGEEGRLDE